LKQLLFILTTDADGGVPVQFGTADGNTNDSNTHIRDLDDVAYRGRPHRLPVRRRLQALQSR
jgi:transposase